MSASVYSVKKTAKKKIAASRRITTATGELFVGRDPPREFKLWDRGPNDTDYGVHVWNERSIKEVVERYEARGNPLLLDVEHNGATLEDGEPAATAGYARLEVRAGEPWLVFDWSAYGADQIRTKQRRFLSAEYDVDKTTGEILALYRVSLVADPGTHRARMLATAEETTVPDLNVIMAAIRAALAAEDPAVAKESLLNLLAELEKSGATDGGGATVEPPSTDPVDPLATAADDDASGDDKDDDKKDKMAAGAKPAPKPVAKPAKPTADRVNAAADDAVRVIQNATRDHLIQSQGDRLDPSIRRWASSQPLEVVRGLLDATPAKVDAKTRAPATRGAGGGVSGLTDRETAMCAAKKIDPAKYAETRAAIAARSNVNGTGV